MYRNLSVTVIIPCLNEKEGLRRIIPQIPSFVDEIIVVDNNSADDSAEAAKRAGGTRIKVIEEKKSGYGNALKKGLSSAKTDLIVAIDGDGSYLPSDIEKLVEKIATNNLDFVWGSRFPLKNNGVISFINFWGNKILTFFTNLLFDTNMKDSQSGMWGIRKNVLDKFDLTQDGMAFSEEIKIEALVKETRSREVFINYQKRIGKSKLSVIKDGINNFLFLLKKNYAVKKSKQGFNKGLILKCLGVGILFFLFFAIIGLFGRGFLDPDSFTHLGLSREISTQGISIAKDIPQFPFMPAIIDSNFLYHWIISLFTSLNLIFAYKATSIFLASLVFTTLFFILNKFKVRFPVFWTILLLSSSSFLFRLLLFRPFSISIILILLSFYLINQKGLLRFFLVSFLYPLFYVIPFSVFIALITPIASFIKKKKVQTKFFIVAVLGAILGIFSNPTFPKNINFTLVQIFETPFTHKASELQSFGYQGLLENPMLSLIFLGIVVAFFYYRRRVKSISSEALSAVFITLIFLLITVRSQRFTEYLAPFTVLAGALVARDFGLEKRFIDWLKDVWRKKEIAFVPVFLGAMLLLTIVFTNSIGSNYLLLKNTAPYDRFQNAADWLKRNTPEKSIVYNVFWDEFPELFYWDDKNYYIAGMDPTFLYEYDKNLYDKYTSVADGKEKNIASIVKNDFRSNYIFVGRGHNWAALKNNLDGNQGLSIAYEDSYAIIYQVK